MEIIRKENWIDFTSSDAYGEFIFRICHTGSIMQLQLITCDEDTEAYCNLNLEELKEIQKVISEVIELKEKNK